MPIKLLLSKNQSSHVITTTPQQPTNETESIRKVTERDSTPASILIQTVPANKEKKDIPKEKFLPITKIS
jgi:hypothetical protein